MPTITTVQTPIGLKRPAAMAEVDEHGEQQQKPVKRRASQACQGCRARKIRCDVAKNGRPCIHCRLDNMECIVLESRRKKKKDNDNQSMILNDSQRRMSGQSPLGSTTLFEQQMLGPASSGTSDMFAGFTPANWQPEASFRDVAIPQVYSAPIQMPTATVQQLPAYITPLPSRFGPEDVSYLNAKGALNIPSVDLRNELLRSYAQYMHPLMPLLDIHRFVRAIEQNDGSNSISLLLFQAIMFTGTATVDMSYLKAIGYANRREARRAFFARTRLLYDLDYEDDPLTLIQSLLLMTYWRENRDGTKETHHWIDIAASLARKIGLHHGPEKAPIDLEPWEQRLRKRVWWTLCMRDVQIALGTRKSVPTTDTSLTVPQLQPSDFDLDATLDESRSILISCQVVRDRDARSQLANMCIQITKLYVCIGQILRFRREALSRREAAKRSDSGSRSDTHEQSQACAKALREWQNKLPEDVRYPPQPSNCTTPSDCIMLHCAFLHMTYYTAVSVLHQSHLQLATRSLPSNQPNETIELSRKCMEHAAAAITKIANNIQLRGLFRYMPSPSITVLLPAIIHHLSEVLAPSSTLKFRSLQDFGTCMQVMASLRDVYAAADYSTAFLQAAIQGADIGPDTRSQASDTRIRRSIVDAMSPSVGSDHLEPANSHHFPVDDYPHDFVSPINQTSPVNSYSGSNQAIMNELQSFGLDMGSIDAFGSNVEVARMENGDMGLNNWTMGFGTDEALLAQT